MQAIIGLILNLCINFIKPVWMIWKLFYKSRVVMFLIFTVTFQQTDCIEFVTVSRVERIFPSWCDVMFRIIHEIIPVSYFLNNLGFYKSSKCILQCMWQSCWNYFTSLVWMWANTLIVVVKSWLNVLSNNQLKRFNISHIRFHILPNHTSSKKIQSMCLFFFIS